MGYPQSLWATQEAGTEVAATIRLQLARIQHSVPEARPVLCALCWIICCGVMSQIGLGEGAVRG